MTNENLAEKEQIKILRYYISELSKYIKETATILDVNTPVTILGNGCIEYWALLSSASNNAIKKLQQENKALKQSQEDAEKVLKNILHNFDKMENHYHNAINEIEEIAKDGLNPICYKSNCSRCKCYNGDDCKAGMISLINNYFTENGEFADGNGDFAEALEDLLDKERSRCNRALPISNKILDIINKAKGKVNDIIRGV